jgi:hypothetical protein
MLTDGHTLALKEIKQENMILKQNLLTIQEQVKNCIDHTMMSIQRACKTKESKAQFNILV